MTKQGLEASGGVLSQLSRQRGESSGGGAIQFSGQLALRGLGAYQGKCQGHSEQPLHTFSAASSVSAASAFCSLVGKYGGPSAQRSEPIVEGPLRLPFRYWGRNLTLSLHSPLKNSARDLSCIRPSPIHCPSWWRSCQVATKVYAANHSYPCVCIGVGCLSNLFSA